MVAVVANTGFTVTSIDVFAGYGGSSQGIVKAGADLKVAANHNRLAIECHAANFPNVDHWCADLVDEESPDYQDVASLPPALFAWFSPGCQHHSPANSLKLYEQGRQAMLFADGEEFDEEAYANSERSRATMSCVIRYLRRYRNVTQACVTENVVEVTSWGPGRDGSTFKWWLGELKNLGYDYECLFLNSMFFPPCPQSRDRIYIVAWRRGNRRPDLDYRPIAYCASQRCGGVIVKAVQTWKRRTKCWPLPRWGKYGANRQYIYTCPDCREEVMPAAWPAYTAIDWSNLGIPIGDRESRGLKMLAPATLERLRRAAGKFRHYPPVVIPTKSVWGTDHPVTSPFTTQTTQQDKALVSAGVVPQRSHNEPVAATEQIPPVTTSGGGGHALMSAAIVQQRYNGPPSGVGAPVPTVTTQQSDLTLISGAVVSMRKHNEPRHVAGQTDALTTFGDQNIAAMVIKNNGDATEAKYRAMPVIDPFGALTTSPTQALASMIVAARGHTYEAGDYTRARHAVEQFFTQHTTEAYGVANMPALVEMHGGGSGERPVTDPAHSVLAGGRHHGLMTEALFAKFNGGPDDTQWHGVGDPFNTVTTTDTHGLAFRPWIEQFLAGADSIPVTEQLATVMTHMRHALAGVEDEPGDPVTDDDLMRICFRMLEPDPELRFVMAFGHDYKLLGNKTQMTAGLGNAVTPPVAEWVTERCLATLRFA